MTLKEWRRFILGNPLLDDEASVVVVDTDGRVVSLSWLLVDHVRRRAENEWTATLPQLRGRGLARLAKLASIRWAAEHDIAEILTGKDRQPADAGAQPPARPPGALPPPRARAAGDAANSRAESRFLSRTVEQAATEGRYVPMLTRGNIRRGMELQRGRADRQLALNRGEDGHRGPQDR